MKKWLDAIWEPFDKEDSTEWILIGFGMGTVVMLLLVGIYDWVHYER